MKLSAKSVRGDSVYLQDKKTQAAPIIGLIFNGETGNLLGAKVGLDTVICNNDLNYDPQKKIYYVKSVDTLCKTEEVVRINNCMQTGMYFNKQLVVTENGVIVGKLQDVIFEPVVGVITEIIVKKGWWIWAESKVISKHSIVNVERNQITIKDDAVPITLVESKTLKNKTAPVSGAALSDLLTN